MNSLRSKTYYDPKDYMMHMCYDPKVYYDPQLNDTNVLWSNVYNDPKHVMIQNDMILMNQIIIIYKTLHHKMYES